MCVGGVGVSVARETACRFCAAEFESAQFARIKIDGCAHFVHRIIPENTQNFLPESPELREFGTKIQVRVVCPKMAPPEKRRKPQI